MNDEIKKLPGKPPRGLPFGEKSSGKSSEYMMKMPGKTPRGLPFDEKSSGKSSEYMMKMPGKTPRGMPFGEPVKKMGGGSVKGYKSGGKVRGDGIAVRGKTKGRMC